MEPSQRSPERSLPQVPAGTPRAAEAGPAAAPPPGQVRPDEAPHPATTEPVLLLAEDNPTNQRTVQMFLQAKGYRVVLAFTGREAVERAAQFGPALILMDVQMPELDGLEAIRQLRATEQFAATPIIALTALAMPGDRERCLAAGADVYLSKPVSLKELAAIVLRLLSPASTVS